MTTNLSVLKQLPFLVNPLCGCEKTWTGASSKVGWLLDFILDWHFFFCIFLIPHPIWWKITQYACTCTPCSCPVGGQFDMEMIVHVRWYGLLFLILSFVRVFTGMCGSRKYPYPCHRRSVEIPREGGGGSKAVISEEKGGFMGNYFSKGWRTMYKTLKATYDRSEAKKLT